jgi:choline dehydrogenase-like flavoprotein
MLGDEHSPALSEGKFHHLGATRMPPDPNERVVDADCRVHGIRNLYVAGSSVFPTYGCSKPTPHTGSAGVVARRPREKELADAVGRWVLRCCGRCECARVHARYSHAKGGRGCGAR